MTTNGNRTAPAGRGLAMHRTLWVVQILLAVFFLVAWGRRTQTTLPAGQLTR
ncbi:hypothetical protein [Pseudonocardia sp. H11422]|uniref:hypothetical protein n=1 Tax=Pseudonocardia sp. H11422 TaxID=2835866 RepID=UPI001BDD5EC2|nr:hypothetical protein [Pseudonocardia sp. H11422]